MNNTTVDDFKAYVQKKFEVVKGKYKDKVKNVYPTVDGIIQKFNTLQEELCKDPISPEDGAKALSEVLPIKVDSLQKKAAPSILISDIGRTASWIMERLKDPTCPFKISKRADRITFLKNTSSNDKGILAWLNQQVHDMELKKVYKTGDISDGWELLKLHFMSSQKQYLCAQFKYTGSVFVDEFIKYIYDYLDIEEDYDVFDMMFKHWLWCLKRRIFGKPVVWHIWLNFNGAQGIGKSQMLNRMFKTFEDFTVITNLKVMNDIEREYKKFTDNYVIIFDDLNSGENSDSDLQLNDSAVDAIKQIMTQEVFTIRQFQTQDQSKVPNTFVPISTANKHLYDIIYDGDAMRRWFEFNCRRAKAPDSYDELNSILERFPEVLQGIDENNDKGYWDRNSMTGQKVTKIQRGYIPTTTSTNGWIDYCHVTPDLDRSQETAFMAPAYKQYITYCRAVGKHAAGLQRVTMILARLWPECIDEKGVAHVFIESKIDDTTGDLVINDIAKIEPIGFTKSNKVAKLNISGDVNGFN